MLDWFTLSLSHWFTLSVSLRSPTSSSSFSYVAPAAQILRSISLLRFVLSSGSSLLLLFIFIFISCCPLLLLLDFVLFLFTFLVLWAFHVITFNRATESFSFIDFWNLNLLHSYFNIITNWFCFVLYIYIYIYIKFIYTHIPAEHLS